MFSLSTKFLITEAHDLATEPTEAPPDRVQAEVSRIVTQFESQKQKTDGFIVSWLRDVKQTEYSFRLTNLRIPDDATVTWLQQQMSLLTRRVEARKDFSARLKKLFSARTVTREDIDKLFKSFLVEYDAENRLLLQLINKAKVTFYPIVFIFSIMYVGVLLVAFSNFSIQAFVRHIVTSAFYQQAASSVIGYLLAYSLVGRDVAPYSRLNILMTNWLYLRDMTNSIALGFVVYFMFLPFLSETAQYTYFICTAGAFASGFAPAIVASRIVSSFDLKGISQELKRLVMRKASR